MSETQNTQTAAKITANIRINRFDGTFYQYGDFDSDDAYRQSLDCEPLEENLPTLAAAKAAATDLTLLDRIKFRVGGQSI